MERVIDKYYKHDFWIRENRKYDRPHFRMEKVSRIVNRIARGRECDLLDVGCGPAVLMGLMKGNIHYHGIDIGIHDPAPHLLQLDFIENPIRFGMKTFDIIVAQGVFEYAGRFQNQKFAEISTQLNTGGRFVASYVNFNHLHKYIYEPYNNVQPFEAFRDSLREFFHIEKVIPTSQRWQHQEPTRRMTKAMQMHLNVDIPFITRLFAVEYLFVCSARSVAS